MFTGHAKNRNLVKNQFNNDSFRNRFSNPIYGSAYFKMSREERAEINFNEFKTTLLDLDQQLFPLLQSVKNKRNLGIVFHNGFVDCLYFQKALQPSFFNPEIVGQFVDLQTPEFYESQFFSAIGQTLYDTKMIAYGINRYRNQQLIISKGDIVEHSSLTELFQKLFNIDAREKVISKLFLKYSHDPGFDSLETALVFIKLLEDYGDLVRVFEARLSRTEEKRKILGKCWEKHLAEKIISAESGRKQLSEEGPKKGSSYRLGRGHKD